MEEIKFYLQRQRIEGKERFNDIHRLHSEVAISIGDLVLLFDSIRAVNMSSSKKLRFRWLGPYRVHIPSLFSLFSSLSSLLAQH
jgi:hypothetical protein